MALFLPVSITGTQTGLALAAAGALRAAAAGRGFPRTPLDEPVAVFLALTAVSALFSADPPAALRRFAGGWTILPMYIAAGWLAVPGRAERFLRWLSLPAALLAAYGIVQHFTGWNLLRSGSATLHSLAAGERVLFLPRGGFSHYQTYANVFYLLLCLGLALAAGVPGRGARVRHGALALLLAAAVVFSLTRGIWAAASVGVGLFALILARRPWRTLAALALAAALLAALAPGALRTRARSMLDVRANVERLLLWETTWNMLRDRPLLGVGVGNYRRAQEAYIRDEVPMEMTRTHAHNVWLQVAVERGLLGFLAFLWLTAAIAREATRAVRRSRQAGGLPLALAAGCAAGIAGFYVDGLVQNNFGDSQVAILFWLVVGLALVAGRRAGEAAAPRGVPA